MNTGDKCFAVYKRALENIASDTPDIESEVIISLWQLTQSLQREIAQKEHKIQLLEAGVAEQENPLKITDDVVKLLAQFQTVGGA